MVLGLENKLKQIQASAKKVKGYYNHRDEIKRYYGHRQELIEMLNDVSSFQAELFNDMIKGAETTPFGKTQDYGSHLTIKDLKDPEKFKVMNTDPDDTKKFEMSGEKYDIEEIIQKISEGDKGAKKYFTNYEILALASSSGTAGKPKLSIVTEKRNAILEKEGAAWFSLNLKTSLKTILGKILFYCAQPYKGKSIDGLLDIVNISGYQAINVPEFLNSNAVIPSKVWSKEDKAHRERKIAYHTLLNKNIKMIGGASAAVAYDKWMYIKKHRDELTQLLRFTGNEKRANELAKLDENFYVDDVFPKLFALNTIQANVNQSDIVRYGELFRNFDKIKQLECGVNLSEGRATYGIPGKGNPGIPAANGYVYVFNEFNDNKVSEERLLMHELEDGKQYRMMMFTHDSPFLWNTDDLFEVDGFYSKAGKPNVPILKHVGKDKYVNFVQEHVHIKEIEQALGDFDLNETFIKPYFNEEGRKGYNIMVEAEGVADWDLMCALEHIESYLQVHPLTYFEVRHQQGAEGGTMAPSRLQVLKPGTIFEYASKQGGQYKHKPIHNDLDFGENFDILKTIELPSDTLKEIKSIAIDANPGKFGFDK